MNSNYISSSRTRTKTHQKAFSKFIGLVVVVAALMGLTGFTATAAQPQQAEAFDPIQWLACAFGEDSAPATIYQITQTSDLQFQLFSKSHAGANRDSVQENALNNVLDFIMTKGDPDSPYSFEAVNERIIGQNFAGTLPVDEDAYKRWNNGPTVNPYNRFGVAGLKFSNYMGEWKHLFIDACEDGDQPDAKYDTGASTNVVRVAAWNVCANKYMCNLPEFNNPITGRAFTSDEVWKDWPERAQMGAEREIATIQPDVFLGQEVKNEGDGSVDVFYDVMCAEMEHGPTGPSTQTICYNPEKFRGVTNEEFEGAQGSQRFAGVGLGPNGGFTWMILEDQSYRRSVFVSVHLQAGAENDAIRKRQANYLTEFMKRRFAGSFYPIVMGGDWNSHDPKSCDALNGLADNKDGAAVELCANGYKATNMIATSPIDLQKASFQGYSPWRSKDGPHLDHIWVNGYVGVGESRVFAPAGPATSDHALVAATVNLNGTSVAQAGDPQDPQTNKYYDTRLEPKSTWEDRTTSADVRTRQFSQGYSSRFFAAASANFTNWIFFFTKVIVVMTIAFIGLAFSDVSDLLGITDLVAGTGGNDGLFNQLHNAVFTPLLIFAILGTAIFLFWNGIVKRQVRSAVGGTLKSLVCFFIAVVISVSPAWFISLPNNVAIVVQSLIAEQLNDGLAGGNGLCASNVAYSDEVLSGTSGTGSVDPEEAAGLLERASVNMQSSAGCMLWYNLLLRPWSEAQFGSEYTELYGTVGGECVSNMNPDNVSPTDPQDYGPEGKHVCLGYDKDEKKNRNFLWVGDPIVPLGGGRCADENYTRCDAKIESNWALLQISTQTNAHAPILPPEDRGVSSLYSQGVAHDWWRIVDAMSNYHEEFSTDNVCQDTGACNDSLRGTETAAYSQPVETDVMQQWDTWVGNNQGQRLMAVMSSLLIAAIAVLAPLVFSALAVIYAVGIALLMAFAPIFFLLGCWAGRGWEIFKAWGDLVINTTMKRIALGVLTILSVTLTATILEQMERVGYWKSLLILVIISIALVKARHKIFNAVAFARYSSRDLGGTAGKFASTLKGTTTGAASLAGAAAVGGVVSARRGEGFGGGALAGFKGQVETLSYRNKTLRSALDTRDLVSGDFENYANQPCVVCGEPLEGGQAISRLNGPDLYGIAHTDCVWGKDEYNQSTELGYLGQSYQAKSEFDEEYSVELKKKVRKDLPAVQEEAFDKTLALRLNELTSLVKLTNEEISRYDRRTTKKRRGDAPVDIPALPPEIAPYVDTAAVELAWREREYEYVRLAYTAGWIAWAQQSDIGSHLDEGTRLQLLTSVQQEGNDLRDRF